jgi:hypothetical protein
MEEQGQVNQEDKYKQKKEKKKKKKKKKEIKDGGARAEE